MATIKSYTDLEQSKKLAEILPLESADMWYHGHYSPWESERKYDDEPCPFHSISPTWDKPCWSLAALLEQVPSDLGSSTLTIEKCDSEPFKYGLNYHDRWGREDDIQTKYYDDLVDACYEMIIKLHEQKRL